MAKKGLDTTFIHYGIRKGDMSLIETLSTQHQLEYDWVREDLLKEFHEKRISNQDLNEKAIERLIEKALLKIK
ncbi:DNA modification system-associated small protein [Telluribacter sp. SYSU D00476]|uniref:DNA modification system-associated small protein n=1 Tax=Telluribacter sp. SYSU D00476 TaxID=2811430 RepID=UPI001FF30937|nr:DNA modification system-associated small protein [Telluribacter sp. SYSU D00476]